jgi:superfamily II DNA or RNA helicase
VSLVGLQDRAYQGRAIDSIFAGFERLITMSPDGRRIGASELVVAATGAGKTILMAFVAERFARDIKPRPNVLVVQHRDELVAQNKAKFMRVNRGWDIAEYSGNAKRIARVSEIYDGSVTFGTAQSLSNVSGLRRLREHRFDLVILDECHHSPADTWQSVIAACVAANPSVRILGLTATPERADGKRLGETFDRVADIIPIHELVEAGWLVRPVAEAAELSIDMQQAARKHGDFDMGDVARMVDKPEIAKVIIDRWLATAGERQTAFFASTKAHARHFCESLQARGIKAAFVIDDTPKDERRASIAAYARRDLQCLVNVGTLTEGWDDQQTSCVALLRPSTSKSLLIQIIGRGLRMLDRELYPTAPPKSDCIVLDFGRSLAAFDGLGVLLDLDPRARRKREPGPAPMKPCASCRLAIPLHARACPLCKFVYPQREAEVPDFDPNLIVLRPFDLVLKTSPFSWFTLPSSRAQIACGDRDVWAIVFLDLAGVWHAFGALPREVETHRGEVRLDKKPRWLVSGTRDEAVCAADAFLVANGDAKDWGARAWRTTAATTDAQIEFAMRIKVPGYVAGDADPRDTLYTINCRITAKLNSDAIRELLPEVKARVALARPAQGALEVAA